MKNLKLSLKKEVISSLEAKNVVGGRPEMPLTMCTPDGPICETAPICPTNNTCGCPTNACSVGCPIVSVTPTACLISLPGDATCWECR